VKAYHGARPNERPLSFVLDGKELDVKEILDRWLSSDQKAGQPIYDYFKILDSDNRVKLLRFNRRHEVWSVKIDALEN